MEPGVVGTWCGRNVAWSENDEAHVLCVRYADTQGRLGGET